VLALFPHFSIQKNTKRHTRGKEGSHLYLDGLVEEYMEGVAGAVRVELLRIGGQNSPTVLQLYSKKVQENMEME
jgi:hypothetical protein